MNRMELERQIIEEGLKRGIRVTKCEVYDRGDYLDFYPEIENDYSSKWVYKHQVEGLIYDLAPIERKHKIADRIGIANRSFNVGDVVELDDVWIRLDAGEVKPKDIIKVGSVCGQYRQGWVTGTVFEKGGVVGIRFDRDIYLEQDDAGWIGHVGNLEELIRTGKIKKIEKGQPVSCGSASWKLRWKDN